MTCLFLLPRTIAAWTSAISAKRGAPYRNLEFSGRNIRFSAKALGANQASKGLRAAPGRDKRAATRRSLSPTRSLDEPEALS